MAPTDKHDPVGESDRPDGFAGLHEPGKCPGYVVLIANLNSEALAGVHDNPKPRLFTGTNMYDMRRLHKLIYDHGYNFLIFARIQNISSCVMRGILCVTLDEQGVVMGFCGGCY